MRSVSCLVCAVILAAAATGGPQHPAAAYSWGPDSAPKGDEAPSLVPFRKGHALRFSSEKKTRLDLSEQLAQSPFKTFGKCPLTLGAVVQLDAAPKTKCALVSKWHCIEGGRSLELGLYPTRELFFSVSGSGNWDAGAREVKSDVKLRVGQPYRVVGVFEPGKRMALYINGHDAGAIGDRVPAAIFDSKTAVWVGNRVGAEATCGFDGLIGLVDLVAVAVDAQWAKAEAKGYELTDPSEPPYPPQELPPVRAITKGPKFHWFTYYDRPQFDPTCRYVLGQEVDFQHRSPKPDDVIKVGMVDLQDGDRWIELDETRAWCWQQGPMLQWRPGSKTEILWNDREGDRFVCHVLDVVTRKKRTIPHPVYAVSPDGRIAVTPDFRRIQDTRPGYGYAGLPDPHKDDAAPSDSGLWRVDLETGEARLIISLADMLKIPYAGGNISQAKHWFNHLLFSTDGARFTFLHRWTPKGRGGFVTRLLTATPEGKDIRVVDPHGQTSHYIWRDPAHILAWAWHPSHRSAFYLYEDGTDKVEPVGLGVMTQNGHCSYVPGNDWILNDTYPTGPRREQHVYLYHVATGQRVCIGHFHSPPQYTGEWRCDTHPRISPDGKLVCFDSPHGGDGRQIHLADISAIVAKPPEAPDARK